MLFAPGASSLWHFVFAEFLGLFAAWWSILGPQVFFVVSFSRTSSCLMGSISRKLPIISQHWQPLFLLFFSHLKKCCFSRWIFVLAVKDRGKKHFIWKFWNHYREVFVCLNSVEFNSNDGVHLQSSDSVRGGDGGDGHIQHNQSFQIDQTFFCNFQSPRAGQISCEADKNVQHRSDWAGSGDLDGGPHGGGGGDGDLVLRAQDSGDAEHQTCSQTQSSQREETPDLKVYQMFGCNWQLIQNHK